MRPIEGQQRRRMMGAVVLQLVGVALVAWAWSALAWWLAVGWVGAVALAAGVAGERAVIAEAHGDREV